jgi:hypothetical protein
MGRNPVGILRQIQGKPNGEYLHPNIVGNEQVVQAVSLVDVTTAAASLKLHAAGGHHS